MTGFLQKSAAFALALLTLLSCAACAGETGPVTTPSSESTTVSPTTDPPAFVSSGKTYDGQSFIILMSGFDPATFNDFTYAEEEQSVLDNAVYQKNLACEELYDIKIETVNDFGPSTGGYSKMKQQKTAGSLGYHLSFIAGYDVANLGYTGVLYDLASIDTLDLKKDWWDQNANAENAVNGNLFYTTGDISIWDDLQQFAVGFNKQIIEEQGHQTQELYGAVREGKFTYEMIYDFVKDYSGDVDGNETMDMKDRYGILTWDDSIYGVFSSTGSKMVEADKSTGELTLAISGNETIFNTLTRYTEIIAETGINYQRYESGGDLAALMFTENRAMFFFGRISSFQNFRDMNTNYGILPYPKASESQDRYYTINSAYHMNYLCTLALDEDIEMRGEITDALAWLSQKHLTPAYHTKTLVGQLVRDDESLEMLELLAANRIYDFGYILQPGKINAQLILTFREMGTGYASSIARYKAMAERELKKVNEEFAEQAKLW